MRHLALTEVLELHRRIAESAAGPAEVRDVGALQSAIAQPRMTFNGADLYPSLEEKAAALMYSLILNHPFVDGNKRIGHAAAEALLMLNGHELMAPVDDAEKIVVDVAAGRCSRDTLVGWIRSRMRPLKLDG